MYFPFIHSFIYTAYGRKTALHIDLVTSVGAKSIANIER